MKGDFTRDTFDPAKHFSRVLMQQGRVTLDADLNEQAAISLRYLRTLARDIIGPYAAPAGKDANGHDLGGFKLTMPDPPDPKGLFSIGKGCYYVDGILVENDTEHCTYKNQPDYDPPAGDPLLQAQQKDVDEFLIYLDVWERHITAVEDDSIGERALGDADTCTRAKVVWQVKALPLKKEAENNKAQVGKQISQQLDACWKKKAEVEKQFIEQKNVDQLKELHSLDEQLARLTQRSSLEPDKELLSPLVRLSKPTLTARVDPGQTTEDACVTPPASKYRGTENQLYRVEIHHGSKDENGNPIAPTFKWSRDNGSVATAWLGVEGSDIQVANVRGFAAGNWVELSDDTNEFLGNPGTLVQLVKVEGDTLSVAPNTKLPERGDDRKHPKVRRWDHIETEAISLSDDNALRLQKSFGQNAPWIDLEDGVQIQFSAEGQYRTGDYWLIPARVATGNVEWPLQTDSDGTPQKDSAGNFVPLEQPPHGIDHHYAPLGLVSWKNGALNIKKDARLEFWPLFVGVTESKATVVGHPPPSQPPAEVAEGPTVRAAPKSQRRARKRPA